MKINVITTEAGKIISRNTIIKLNVNPFDIEGTKVPISLYQKKGDLLVAKGYSNPAAIDVGSDGQVLVSDSIAILKKYQEEFYAENVIYYLEMLMTA